MQKLKELIAGDELVVAPVALNPIMARLAQEAGFKAVYLSGGSLGWLKCVTEANLGLSELAEVAVDMRAACRLPIVLDAGGGWGDPVHVHRTVALTEAARASPPSRSRTSCCRGAWSITSASITWCRWASWSRKSRRRVPPHRSRSHHHRAHQCATPRPRRSAAPRRGLHKAGADMLFCYTRSAEELRLMGERLPAPLMMFAPPDGFGTFALKERDLAGLGYRLAASSGTAFAAMVKAVRQSYQCLAKGRMDPFLGPGGAEQEMKAAQETCGLDQLLQIERRTMKDA